jgi:phosphoribosyl-ATP pyrophosphohydrolase
VYQSRSRGIWRKGETSGATQELVRIDLDCDRDALRFTVRQHGGGFCHRGTRTCWGEERGLGRLARRLAARLKSAPDGSYTRRLLDNPALLACKLIEEAHELVRAETHADVVWEAADLIYFTLVRMVGAGVDLSAVEAELERRSLQVTRRDGAGKEKEAGA